MIFRDKGLRLLRRSPLSSDDLQGIAPCESPHTVIETKRGHCNTYFVTKDQINNIYKRGLQVVIDNLQPSHLVDLRRVELRSAQGNHTLSTCLFQSWIFEHWQDLNHQPMPYPLIFICALRHTQTISDLPAPLNPQIRNNILGAMSRRITL